MSAKSLKDLEASIEELDLQDQVRLLQYLAPRIAGSVLSATSGSAPRDPEAAWQRYRAVGEQLAATSTPGGPSLTEAVSQMRR